MNTGTNPHLEACPDPSRLIAETAQLVGADHLGDYGDVSSGSSFRLVVEDEDSRQREYYIFRRPDAPDMSWHPWVLHAKDTDEGKPVVLFGATTPDRGAIAEGAIKRGMGFLFAEVDLCTPGSTPEGAKEISEGVIVVQAFHLKKVVDVHWPWTTPGATESDAAEN